MLIYITRKEHFNAAHRMFREEWSVEKNREVFGKCANPNYHGHNYTLLVTVKGQADTSTPYLIDLKILKLIINEQVIEKLDHKNLNLDVSFMQGKMATTELLCIAIFDQLKAPIEAHAGVFLHAVKLYETENNAVEYFGGL
jgi:6-pyruvoyltetrahydropterin/6-carboxytetrahydropterin synthase